MFDTMILKKHRRQISGPVHAFANAITADHPGHDDEIGDCTLFGPGFCEANRGVGIDIPISEVMAAEERPAMPDSRAVAGRGDSAFHRGCPRRSVRRDTLHAALTR